MVHRFRDEEEQRTGPVVRNDDDDKSGGRRPSGHQVERGIGHSFAKYLPNYYFLFRFNLT